MEMHSTVLRAGIVLELTSLRNICNVSYLEFLTETDDAYMLLQPTNQNASLQALISCVFMLPDHAFMNFVLTFKYEGRLNYIIKTSHMTLLLFSRQRHVTNIVMATRYIALSAGPSNVMRTSVTTMQRG